MVLPKPTNPDGQRLRVLDLFSGIGGFSIGLERSGGFRTVAFCEIAPFPRRVLRRRWPNVPIYDDVRGLTRERLASAGLAVDVICGGFPCQDISNVGRRAGIEGARSGLWSEIVRLLCDLRPRILIVENVAALLGRGLDRVLGDLASIGYDAEWHCIPAAALGAPHIRDRVWVVAYPDRESRRDQSANARYDPRGKGPFDSGPGCGAGDARALANADGIGRLCGGAIRELGRPGEPFGILAPSLAHGCQSRDVAGEIWSSEPAVGRMADGLPHQLDRLRAIGNSVVPQIPELIGQALMQR